MTKSQMPGTLGLSIVIYLSNNLRDPKARDSPNFKVFDTCRMVCKIVKFVGHFSKSIIQGSLHFTIATLKTRNPIRIETEKALIDR